MWLAASSNCELRPVNMMAREAFHWRYTIKRIPSAKGRMPGYLSIYPYAPACPNPQSSAIAKRILVWFYVFSVDAKVEKRKKTFLISK